MSLLAVVALVLAAVVAVWAVTERSWQLLLLAAAVILLALAGPLDITVHH